MSPGVFKIYAAAKKYMANGTITLGVGVFRMTLHRASASAAILVLSTRSVYASIPGEISARGNYVTGGKSLVPGPGQWVTGASARQMKFTYTVAGIVYRASASALNNIKYALIRNSVTSTTGKVLCFCTLSTAAFTVTASNTLTVVPNASGVFTLA